MGNESWAAPESWAEVIQKLRDEAPDGTVETTYEGYFRGYSTAAFPPVDKDAEGQCVSRSRSSIMDTLSRLQPLAGDDGLIFDIRVPHDGPAQIHLIPGTPELDLGPSPTISTVMRAPGVRPEPFRRSPVRYPQPPSAGANPQTVAQFVHRLLPKARPASADQIAEAERRWNVRLPDEVRALYSTASSGTLVDPHSKDDEWYMDITPLDSPDRGEDWFLGWQFAAEEVLCDPTGRVQELGFSPAWFEVGNDGGGNAYAIDLAPGPNGAMGQVVFLDRGEALGGATWLAPSLTEFFAMNGDDRSPDVRNDSKDLGPTRDLRLRIGWSKSRSFDDLTPTTQVLIVNKVETPLDLTPITGHPTLRSVSVDPGPVTSVSVVSSLPHIEWLLLDRENWEELLTSENVPQSLYAAGFAGEWTLGQLIDVVNRLRALWGQGPLVEVTLQM